MKLTFVIPAHNEESYLDKCLTSVVDASKRCGHETEIIVVNNASTDNTKRVAQMFEEVIVVDEPKKGLVQARQAGFLASKGDLIANIDADTVLTENWISKVFEEFQKDNDLVALSGPFIYYDLSKISNALIKTFFYFGSLSNFLNQRVFKNGAVLQGGNFIIRKDALKKVNGYNMDLTFFGEDIDIAKRISRVGKVKFTSKLPIYTSGRRLKAEGVVMTGVRASFDYLWITIKGRPFRKAKNQRDIRN